ncbi:MAG: FprA family A-type flavoprotein [Chlorobi bacterium]|nr:FprA family A-type flavoprotein [Chlorobiota bacterium]
MYKEVKLSEKIYYIGVNDRRTSLFENMWPLDRGISYNSFLINDDKIAIIDTVEAGFFEKWLDKVRTIIKDRPIDYIIVNHMEPDHSSAIRFITELYPDVKIVGNRKTTPMLEGYYGITKNVTEVKEGDVIELGTTSLSFHPIPMVHWPESMVCFEQSSGILFSTDAFGSYGTLDGGVFDDEMDFEYFRDEMRRYYSNIVGKYGNPVQKALSKLSALDIKLIAPAHGPLIRKNIKDVIARHDRWSKHETEKGVVIAYASMYGNTEVLAEVTARSLAENGIERIRMYDVSKTHISYIISDVFKYRGFIMASPTYSNELHPNMEALVMKLQHMGFKNHLFGVIGSYTWGGVAAKKLLEAGQNLNWELVGTPIEQKYSIKEESFNACIKLGEEMAKRLKE